MRTLFRAAAIVLFSCLAAIGGDILAIQDGKLVTVQAIVDPKVSIVGITEKISVGKMAIASVTLGNDPASGFVKSSKYNWRVEIDGEEQVFLEGTNNRIGFVPEAGRLVVSCSGIITYVVGDKTVEKETKSTIEINLENSPKPTPDPKPPAPTPTPTPTPIVPDGYLDYTKISYTAYSPLTLDVVKKTQLAKDLANGYRGIAAKAMAGAYPNSSGDAWIKAITLDMKNMGNKAVADNGLKTVDLLGFGGIVSDKLHKDYVDGKLNDTGNWSSALNAIADGLNLIK